jgi:hypothetical protein
MPLPVTSQYAPPQSWEEFESLCADIYARIWDDAQTQKHGRQGQPQGGVDVYGRPAERTYTGIQCKKREIWPPIDLTTAEIDEEVAKAKTWEPGLKHYIIATTASNDERVQAHARAITKAHKKKRLFSVEVVSWDEITRRLADYPDLLRKYGYLPNLDLVETVKLVVEQVHEATQVRGAPTSTKIFEHTAHLISAPARPYLKNGCSPHLEKCWQVRRYHHSSTRTARPSRPQSPLQTTGRQKSRSTTKSSVLLTQGS